LSTFYFNSAVGSPTQMGSAVSAFLGSTEGQRSNGLAWTRVPEVATFNEVTGTLESVAGLVPGSGVGTNVTDALSPTTQGLLQLRTGLIVFGRLLRGRIFLPGPCEAHNGSSGGPLAGYVDPYETAAATLVGDANTDLVIWSQTHGVKAPVASADVWSKWASLRSRRD
jgi:hypothetical protein